MPKLVLDGSPHDGGWVMATMLFPNDLTLRDQCFAVNRARLEVLKSKDSDIISIDSKTLALLIDAPGYSTELMEMTTESTKRGIVAGDILVSLYLMKLFEFEEPSIKKAIYISREYGKNARYGDGEKLDISNSKIRDHWEEFKPVAHLWAAQRINKAYEFAPQEKIFCEELPKFLGVAAGIAEFGCSFIPLRSKPKVPILDEEKVWTIPDSIPRQRLKSDRIPDGLKKFLKNY